MKQFLKQYRILPFLLALLVTTTFSYTIVHAQTSASLSGDEVCGQWDPGANGGKGAVKNPCSINMIAVVLTNVLKAVVVIGLPLLVVFISFRFVMAWFALQQGNANAYKDALKKSWNALLGFLLIVALFGGLLFTMLKYLGVSSSILDLEVFKKLSSVHLVERAYAQLGDEPVVDAATYRCPDGTMVLPSDAKFCRGGTMATSCTATNIGSPCNLPNNGTGKCSQVLINNVEQYTCAPKLTANNPITDPTYQNNVTPQTQSQGQPATMLPNPLGVDSVWGLLLNILRLIMRFFIYPALITIWVWSGFAFVFAQGRPEALTKAKKLVMWAFVSSFVIFMIQAFLIAVQGTVEKIVPTKTSTTAQPTSPDAAGTPDNRTAPQAGAYGSVCTTQAGTQGMIDTTGACSYGRGGPPQNGTACDSNGQYGQVSNGMCVPLGGRR